LFVVRLILAQKTAMVNPKPREFDRRAARRGVVEIAIPRGEGIPIIELFTVADRPLRLS